MDASTPGRLLRSFRKTSTASASATSSPASAAGAARCGSPASATVKRSGPAPAPASRSPSPASRPASTTLATSGQPGGVSLRSAVLQSSLESRLRALLAGSDLCEVTWKPWATPWGASLCRPRARVRTTCATATGLWQTMVEDDALDRRGGKVEQPRRAEVAGAGDPGGVERHQGRRRTRTGRRGSTPSQVAGKHGQYLAVQAILGSSERTAKPGALNPEFVSG